MASPTRQKRQIVDDIKRNAKRIELSNSDLLNNNANFIVREIMIESQRLSKSSAVQNNIIDSLGSQEIDFSNSTSSNNTVNLQVSLEQMSQLTNQTPLTSNPSSSDVLALQAQNQQLKSLVLAQQRQLQSVLNTPNEAYSSCGSVNENAGVSESVYTFLNVETAYQALSEFTGEDSGIGVENFIKQCIDLHSRIHFNEHANFLCVVKTKIKGQALDLISDYIENVSNINELIDLLTEIFIFSNDTFYSREVLRLIKQRSNEPIVKYSSRVTAYLARAQSIARQNSSEAEIPGKFVYLNEDAIHGFIRGLRNGFIRRLLLDKKPVSLQEAICWAKNNDDKRIQSQSNDNQDKLAGTIESATDYAIFAKPKNKSYNCFKLGHILKECRFKKCYFC